MLACFVVDGEERASLTHGTPTLLLLPPCSTPIFTTAAAATPSTRPAPPMASLVGPATTPASRAAARSAATRSSAASSPSRRRSRSAATASAAPKQKKPPLKNSRRRLQTAPPEPLISGRALPRRAVRRGGAWARRLLLCSSYAPISLIYLPSASLSAPLSLSCPLVSGPLSRFLALFPNLFLSPLLQWATRSAFPPFGFTLSYSLCGFLSYPLSAVGFFISSSPSLRLSCCRPLFHHHERAPAQSRQIDPTPLPSISACLPLKPPLSLQPAR